MLGGLQTSEISHSSGGWEVQDCRQMRYLVRAYLLVHRHLLVVVFTWQIRLGNTLRPLF